MAKANSEIILIEGMDDFFSITKSNLRSTVIRLKSGALCIYSPVSGLGEDMKAALKKIGEVGFILAPNHYHNKGITEFCEAFPKAKLIASPASKPRLEKITGQIFEGLEEFSSDLPADTQIISPQGLKTGEIWIVTNSAWLVVDAFAGPKKESPNPELLKTFPRYGIEDRDTYVHWAKTFITSNPPSILVPCHGSIVRGSNLAQKLSDLVSDNL